MPSGSLLLQEVTEGFLPSQQQLMLFCRNKNNHEKHETRDYSEELFKKFLHFWKISSRALTKKRKKKCFRQH